MTDSERYKKIFINSNLCFNRKNLLLTLQLKNKKIIRRS